MEYRTANEIRNDFLDHLENELSKIEGTYNFDIASSIGYVVNKLYDYMAFWSKQTFIDTATEDEFVEKHAATFGLSRRTAGKATGTVQIEGKKGTTIPLGTVVINKYGQKYVTLNDLMLNSQGKGEVGIEAVEGGSVGNCAALDIVSFEIANTNLYKVSNQNEIHDGFDVESNENLVSRCLEKAREPAHSGNIYNYIQWAKEVSGVGRAACNECPRGAGTVDVLISDYFSNAASNDLCQKVKEYIEQKRPIGADVLVKSFDVVSLGMDIKVLLKTGYTLTEVAESIKIDLQVANNDNKLLRSINGAQSVSVAQIIETIIHVDGVQDCEVNNLTITDIDNNAIMKLDGERINVTEY